MTKTRKNEIIKTIAKEMNCTSKQVTLLESSSHGFSESFSYNVNYSQYASLGFNCVVEYSECFNNRGSQKVLYVHGVNRNESHDNF